jgi:hypothetical protein
MYAPTGNESCALVEWAPSQRASVKRPAKANVADAKYCGTIESDPFYTDFVKETQARDEAETSNANPVNVQQLMAAVEERRLKLEGAWRMRNLRMYMCFS